MKRNGSCRSYRVLFPLIRQDHTKQRAKRAVRKVIGTRPQSTTSQAKFQRRKSIREPISKQNPSIGQLKTRKTSYGVKIASEKAQQTTQKAHTMLLIALMERSSLASSLPALVSFFTYWSFFMPSLN